MYTRTTPPPTTLFLDAWYPYPTSPVLPPLLPPHGDALPQASLDHVQIPPALEILDPGHRPRMAHYLPHSISSAPVAAVGHLDLLALSARLPTDTVFQGDPSERHDNTKRDVAALSPRASRAVGVPLALHLRKPHSVLEARIRHPYLACAATAATAEVLSRDEFGADASRVYGSRACSIALFQTPYTLHLGTFSSCTRLSQPWTADIFIFPRIPQLASHWDRKPRPHSTLNACFQCTVRILGLESWDRTNVAVKIRIALSMPVSV
ncbi:hypothetical protein B0H13DRAFT_2317983 [Mycena leptocephala]|nr:hypothetical protein B0H13DRAFT_2317983 [Mycena leptocephala]